MVSAFFPFERRPAHTIDSAPIGALIVFSRRPLALVISCPTRLGASSLAPNPRPDGLRLAPELPCYRSYRHPLAAKLFRPARELVPMPARKANCLSLAVRIATKVPMAGARTPSPHARVEEGSTARA